MSGWEGREARVDKLEAYPTVMRIARVVEMNWMIADFRVIHG